MDFDFLNIAGHQLKLDRPIIMGVLNTTPDSFSDGGLWGDADLALRHAMSMATAGADIIDIGGESTRPGAAKVSLDEELSRVIPLIERLRSGVNIPISIDTCKPEVMRQAVAAGAGMINDVYALQKEGALTTAAELQVAVCLMHMQGKPESMQAAPDYQDVVEEVSGFLLSRAQACLQAGLQASSIVIDPGFGFGKSLQHNRELFHAIPQLRSLGYPLLVGVSRKTMLGDITGKPIHQRLSASVTAAALAAAYGASILRVHDVAETVDALKVFNSLSK